MDPEVIKIGRSRSSKSDVYSFGVILFEIISAKRFSSPFHEDPSCPGSLDYVSKSSDFSIMHALHKIK